MDNTKTEKIAKSESSEFINFLYERRNNIDLQKYEEFADVVLKRFEPDKYDGVEEIDEKIMRQADYYAEEIIETHRHIEKYGDLLEAYKTFNDKLSSWYVDVLKKASEGQYVQIISDLGIKVKKLYEEEPTIAHSFAKDVIDFTIKRERFIEKRRFLKEMYRLEEELLKDVDSREAFEDYYFKINAMDAEQYEIYKVDLRKRIQRTELKSGLEKKDLYKVSNVFISIRDCIEFD